jgi:hypothetical protein
MTEDELIEIERRCQAARSGPWVSFIEGRGHTSGSSFIMIGEDDDTRSDDIELSGATTGDQDFIAHARQDVPQLLKEVRRLRKQLEQHSGSVGKNAKLCAQVLNPTDLAGT